MFHEMTAGVNRQWAWNLLVAKEMFFCKLEGSHDYTLVMYLLRSLFSRFHFKINNVKILKYT